MDSATRTPLGAVEEEMELLRAAYEAQTLMRRLVEAQELERHRIAGELHDRVGQALSALNINLDIALGLVPADQREVRMRLADSLALVEGTLQAIENLMAELRPPLLDEYGLGAALVAYAKAFSKRTGVRVAVHDPLDLGRTLRSDAAVALFRISQEALANISRHAEAASATISLSRAAEGILMEISDDGRGFEPRQLAHTKRWGMAIMQERVAAIGGRLEVTSAPGAGTTVRTRVPAAPAGAPAAPAGA
jgi:two-component system sensor histidine kinase UhpB